MLDFNLKQNDVSSQNSKKEQGHRVLSSDSRNLIDK